MCNMSFGKLTSLSTQCLLAVSSYVVIVVNTLTWSNYIHVFFVLVFPGLYIVMELVLLADLVTHTRFLNHWRFFYQKESLFVN